MTKRIFTQVFDASQSKRTKKGNGYLLIEDCTVARTGIQNYTAKELGLNDSNELIPVWRPPEEVFKAESIQTYDNAPLTVLHPKQFVDLDNHNDLAVGDSIKVKPLQDSGVITADLLFKTRRAVKAIDAGVEQLSCGYESEIKFIDGVTPEGEPYKAIQTNISVNHIALVPKGRAGNARLNDSIINFEEENNMPNEHGHSHTVTDPGHNLPRHTHAVTDHGHNLPVAAIKPVAVTKQLTDAEIDALVEKRAAEKAQKIIEDKAATDDVVNRAKLIVKDYSPNAEVDRRQVMLDCMNTAAANPAMKKVLDAMFSGADPKTLNDNALNMGFTFITNMARDLPYMLQDAKPTSVTDGLSTTDGTQKEAKGVSLMDSVISQQCKVY